MRFLVDACAGRQLAKWLHGQGHDVLFSDDLGADPGDQALLQYAAAEDRVLVTIDMDFGELIFVHRVAHAGLVRLPDVPLAKRIALLAGVLQQHQAALEMRAVVTVRGQRIRISHRLSP